MAIKKSKVKGYKPSSLQSSVQVYQPSSLQPTPTAMGPSLKKSTVKVPMGGLGKPTAVPIQPLMAPNSVYTNGIQPTPTAMGVDNMAGQNAAMEKMTQKPMDSYSPDVGYYQTGKNAQGVFNDPAKAYEMAKKKKSKVKGS